MDATTAAIPDIPSWKQVRRDIPIISASFSGQDDVIAPCDELAGQRLGVQAGSACAWSAGVTVCPGPTVPFWTRNGTVADVLAPMFDEEHRCTSHHANPSKWDSSL